MTDLRPWRAKAARTLEAAYAEVKATLEPKHCWCGLQLVPSQGSLDRDGAYVCPAKTPGEAEPHDVWVYDRA